MATVNPISVIESMHGKLAKDDDFVFTERYGKIYVISFKKSTVAPSEAQQFNRKCFKLAYYKVAFDLADPVKKAAWQTLADLSGGKYKTARGIAFATYFAQLKASL